MPATGIKVRFVYSQEVYGISESFVQPSTDFDATLAKAVALLKRRIAMSALNLSFVGLTMSMLSGRRVFRSRTLVDIGAITPPTATYAKFGGTVPNNAESGKGCLVLTCESGVVRRKKIFLAGLPDIVFNTNPEGPDPTIAAWLQQFNRWQGQLTNDAWSFVGITLEAGAFAPQIILNWTLEALTNNLVANVPIDPGFKIGGKVLVRGVRRTSASFRSPNAVQTVKAINTAGGVTSVTLDKTSNVDSSQFLPVRGTLTLYDTTTFPITAVGAGKQTTRKRGNRFLVAAGRARTRRLLP